MGKAKRKPKPSVPHYYWLDTDNCWACPSNKWGKACTNCRRLKRYIHTKDKGKRHTNKQRLRCSQKRAIEND